MTNTLKVILTKEEKENFYNRIETVESIVKTLEKTGFYSAVFDGAHLSRDVLEELVDTLRTISE